jgi:hypothetical protein
MPVNDDFHELFGRSNRKLLFVIAAVHSREQFKAMAAVSSSDCKETFQPQLTLMGFPRLPQRAAGR